MSKSMIFKQKVLVNKKVLGLNILVSDAELVKIREALDKTQADLNDLASI